VAVVQAVPSHEGACGHVARRRRASQRLGSVQHVLHGAPHRCDVAGLAQPRAVTLPEERHAGGTAAIAHEENHPQAQGGILPRRLCSARPR